MYLSLNQKQPQLEPKPMNGDSISLRNVRPDRIETAVPKLVTIKSIYYNKWIYNYNC